MLTLTCTLTWPDGASAEARLVARAPESEVPVAYTGAIDRLPSLRPTECDAAFLTWLLRRFAAASGASFTDRREGEFDTWAE